MSEHIILRTLLWIGKGFVSLTYFFEFFLRILISFIPIWMILHSELPIGLLDVGLTRLPVNLEYFVIIFFHGFRILKREDVFEK